MRSGVGGSERLRAAVEVPGFGGISPSGLVVFLQIVAGGNASFPLLPRDPTNSVKVGYRDRARVFRRPSFCVILPVSESEILSDIGFAPIGDGKDAE